MIVRPRSEAPAVADAAAQQSGPDIHLAAAEGGGNGRVAVDAAGEIIQSVKADLLARQRAPGGADGGLMADGARRHEAEQGLVGLRRRGGIAVAGADLPIGVDAVVDAEIDRLGVLPSETGAVGIAQQRAAEDPLEIIGVGPAGIGIIDALEVDGDVQPG